MEMNAQSVKQPRRMRLLPTLTLLLPIIYLVVTAVHLLVPTIEPGMRIAVPWEWTDGSRGRNTYSNGRFEDPPIWFHFGNFDRDPKNWTVSVRSQSASDVPIRVQVATETRSGPINILKSPAATRYEVRMTIMALSQMGVQPNAQLDAAFQREFGGLAFAQNYPAFQVHLMPSIEAEVGKVVVEAIGGPVTDLPHVIASVHGGSLLKRPRLLIGASSGKDIRVVYWIESNRWAELSKAIPHAIGIWLLVSICITGFVSVSRERKARRWIAMKCPKCGYERQHDRAECPECGMKYERPSYVMWDPTEVPDATDQRGGSA